MEYREVYFTSSQLNKLVSKLKSKNFERHGLCETSQTWFNPETDETVILVKGC